MIFRVKSHLSLFYTNHFSFIWCHFLNWNRRRLRWEKGNSIQCSKIVENQCRIKTIHLTEGEGAGGVLGQSRCEDCIRNGRKRFEIFLQQCIQMPFSQWRVAFVVMLSLRVPPFYWMGGGVRTFQQQVFFAGTSARYLSFTGYHFHLTVKGVIKISSHIQGRGWWRMPNSAKLLSTTKAPM